MTSLFELSASDAAALIRNGQISALELVTACLDRIDERDDSLHAWQLVDDRGALAAAKRADNLSEKNGLLHGVPVGLKDIIDTADLPTTYGSKAFQNHQPERNADCVNALTAQGAIILGKTVTTEFAFFAPGLTVNPHNHAHTPGGSSSGSAAAVADFHVPIALGTQTAGSIIRPASFNGVYGYKPSYNFYSNRGVHPLSPSLDTLGSFTRSIDDFVLLNAVLGNSPPISVHTSKPFRLAVVRTPYWAQASPAMRSAFVDFQQRVESNGLEIVDAATLVPTLDEMIAEISDAQLALMASEAEKILSPIVAEHGDLIRPETKNLVAMGLDAPADIVEKISSARTRSNEMIAALFDIADVVFTPSALGVAPAGIESTGDPVFNRAWTFAGLPCVNLPLTKAEGDLPLGAQLVGKPNGDGELLAYAKFCADVSPYQIVQPL